LDIRSKGKRFVTGRNLLPFVCFCWILASFGLGLSQAQTPTPALNPPTPELNPTPPALNPASDETSELQAIRARLAEQDEELHRLRQQLDSIHADVHALPPVGDNLPLNPNQPGVLPTGVSIPVDTSDMQMSSMANKLDAAVAAPDKKANQPYEVGTDLKFSAIWNKGLQFQTPNKDFRFHIGGIVQFDMNYFDNPPGIQQAPAVGGIGPQPDSLNMRRVRLRMDGTMYEVFDYLMQVDFANLVTPAGSPNAQSPATTSPAFNELYINWGQIPYIDNLRFGNIKEPIGFEHMMTDSQLPFMERSYLQDFVFGPFNGGYSPGIEMIKWREDQRGTLSVGWFGSEDDQFGFSLGNDYAVTSRLTWLPYYDEPSEGRYMLHLGVAGSIRAADEGFVRFRDRGDIRSGPPGILNPVYADTNYSGRINATTWDIMAGEIAWVQGSFSAVAEYVGVTVNDAAIGAVSHGTPFFQGGYVQCAYLLTGEHEIYDRKRGTFERIVPYENVFWVHDKDGNCCHGWGAWQVLARYNALDLNDNGIIGGELNSFTFGVNWIWNPQARMQFNYDFTNRSAIKSVAQADINAVGTRFSFDF
jgi:phosphate-selective porin OprO/OprP